VLARSEREGGELAGYGSGSHVLVALEGEHGALLVQPPAPLDWYRTSCSSGSQTPSPSRPGPSDGLRRSPPVSFRV
jgi:hypothetical protein